MTSPDAGGGPVRPMTIEDLAATSALHRQELDDSFFAALGPRFLRAYHQTYIDSPYAVALVVASGSTPYAFLLGVLSPAAHGTHVLRQHGVRLVGCAALSLLVHPRLLVLFLRTRVVRYARGLWRRLRPARTTSARAEPGGTAAVLAHIAVSPRARRLGAGRALESGFAEFALRSSSDAIVLLTSPEGPGPAFYRGLGYHDDGPTTGTDGQLWQRFRRSLHGHNGHVGPPD